MPDTTSTVRYLVPRGKSVALAYPFAIGDVEYREVEVRRLSVKQIGEFADQLKAAGDGANLRWPIFYANGEPLSDDAWDATDPVDRQKIDEAGNDFLREIFPAPPATSTETNPENSPPSSSAPSNGATGEVSSEPSPTPPAAS